MQLDDDDRRILQALQEDARRSYRDVAALTGLSTPTVSARVKRLEEMGLVLGYTLRLDPSLLGRTQYLVALRTRPADAGGLAERLTSLPGVEEALVLAGGLVHARAATPDLHALLARLDAMPEVTGYDVHPIVHARLANAAAPVEPEVRLACHECKGPIHGEGIRKKGADGREHWYCCRSCQRTFEERLDARMRKK